MGRCAVCCVRAPPVPPVWAQPELRAAVGAAASSSSGHAEQHACLPALRCAACSVPIRLGSRPFCGRTKLYLFSIKGGLMASRGLARPAQLARPPTRPWALRVGAAAGHGQGGRAERTSLRVLHAARLTRLRAFFKGGEGLVNIEDDDVASVVGLPCACACLVCSGVGGQAPWLSSPLPHDTPQHRWCARFLGPPERVRRGTDGRAVVTGLLLRCAAGPVWAV